MHRVGTKALLALLALALTACAAKPDMAPAGAAVEVARITPVPDGCACGGEIFKVAFEEGVDY